MRSWARARWGLYAFEKSPLGKAIYYWTHQQPSLRAFLDDGRFSISNAHVERLLRVVATFRKNSLFVGSLDAGERYVFRGVPADGQQSRLIDGHRGR